MNPAELNHWAAEFMGWTKLEQGDGWPDVWVHSEDYKALVMNCSEWNSHLSHDDCQRVIEKAIDRGMDLRTFALELSGRNASMYDIGRIILATPEQKLRAVHAAWMEKK